MIPRLTKEAREVLEQMWEAMDDDHDVEEKTALRALLDWYDEQVKP